MMESPIVIVINIFILVLLGTFAYAGFHGAPWFPTRKKDVTRFLTLADIKFGQKMYDLGCGDGRLICAAAKVGADAYGLELSLFPFILANIRRYFNKDKERIKISYQNIWNTNLRDADVIYVWLMPGVMTRLQKKFENELKSGTKIVTYCWPIKEWRPIKIDKVLGSPNLYLYEVKN